ncbi:MAG: hypothetical protein GF315_10795 [candidate division Zixibacteria bacterium]|nr:hypothetical protein [candidate division Zixibacteria bacterium]
MVLSTKFRILILIAPVISISISLLALSSLAADVTIKGFGTGGPYYLSDKPIVVGSDSVCLNGELLQRGEDYEINYLKGYITTVEPIDSSTTLTVKFEPLFFRLDNPYYLYKPVSIDLRRQYQADSIDYPIKEPEPTRVFQPGLTIGGSKLLSVEFGNSLDPDLSQALDLTVRGPIVRGVDAAAYVSDRSAQSAAGGTSSTIEELDRFFIKLTSKNFIATLGDFQVAFDQLKLARYNKKLKGVTLEYMDESNRGVLSGASSAGRFTTNRFRGREGDQGPYLLTDPSGARGIVILSGTETVFLDGEKLTRGSDNDYFIDYTNAHITFTPRRLITSDSRIEVEFEYSRRDFSRGFYTSRVYRQDENELFSFGATVIAETDDKNRPLNVTLTQEEKEAIRDAGAAEYAYKSGVEFVGEGEGEYVRLTDSTGYVHYEYVGVDSGAYRITFSNVGFGNGDYIYLGRGIYSFQGIDSGEYAPVVRLPIPRSHYLYGVDGAFHPSDNFRLTMESAYSRENRNLFLNDEAVYDDPALILKSDFGAAISTLLLPDTVTVDASYRHTGKNYAPFAQFRESDYYNKWNLPIDYQDATEDVGEASVTFGYNERYNFEIQGGRLSRALQGNSDRWSVGTNLELPLQANLRGDFRESRYSSKEDSLGSVSEHVGRLQESNSSFEIQQWILKPMIGYEYRNDVKHIDGNLQTGDRYSIYETGLTITPHSKISNTVTYALQLDDAYIDKWLRRDEAVTIKEQISLRDLPKGLNLNYQYTFREKTYKEISGVNNRQHLSYFNSFYSSNVLLISYNHRYNRTRSALRIERFIKVDEGAGDYRYEDGEYIPDPFGDYVRIIEEAGEYRPVSEVENSVNIRYDGKQTKNPYLNGIKTETTLEFDQRTEETGLKFIDLLNPWRDVDHGVLLNENLRFMQDLYVYPSPNNRRRELRLRYSQNRIINSGGGFTGDYDDERSGEIRLRDALTPVLSLEAEYSRKHRVVSGITDLRIISDIFLPDLTYTPQPAIEVGSGVKFRRDKEELDNYSIYLMSFLPHLRWNFSRKGRLDVNPEVIRVWSENLEGETFNYRLAEGNRVGVNYRVSIRGVLRIGENSSGELTYNLRKRPLEKEQHFLRAQVKYDF